MKKTNKKGFTIVELVIVIAVIAILAAVLIPTFISLTKKANQSADIQAVNQMNKQLVIANAETPITDVREAILALDKVNIDLENYKALASDHYFFFVVDKDNVPMVVYTDEKYDVIYPENVNIDGCQLMSLSGAIPMDDSWKNNISNGKVEITSGEQLASLMEAYSDPQNTTTGGLTEIKLTKDIDLKGAAVDFGKTSNLTFDGNNKTVSGFRADKNAVTGTFNGEAKEYGYALFGNVGQNQKVTVKDLKISGAVISNTADDNKAFGHSGILFGTVDGEVVIENVTISNCTVIGGDKVGSLIGQLQGHGKATIKSVTVSDTKLLGLGFIAYAIGLVDPNAKVSFESVNFNNMTLGINEAQWSCIWYASDKNWATGESVKIADVKAYMSGHPNNTYLPWKNTKVWDKDASGNALSPKKTAEVWQLQGMTTTDYYWLDNLTHTPDDENYTVTLKAEYKVTVNGQDGGYKVSSSADRD